MFAKRARHCFMYLILIGIAALASSAVGSRASAQEEAEPSLDQLFEEAFAAVAEITDPSNRIFSAYWLGETDVNYGGGRLEAQLIPLLNSALEEIPSDRQAYSLAYVARTLAVYGRTSEVLGVMRKLNDAWNYGGKVLQTLAKRGDVATALILAEREGQPRHRYLALTHIVHGLAEAGKLQEAEEIFNMIKPIYNSLSETRKKTYASEYLVAMAQIDPRGAERQALASADERSRRVAILDIVEILVKSDPERALGLALKINDETYRQFAISSVILATARKPDRRRIYQQALALADPSGRANTLQWAVFYALEDGELARAREELDRLDALLPGLSEEDRAWFADPAAYRLAIEVLSGDVNQVFERMEGLTYSDDLLEGSEVRIIANALRQNGYYDLGRRVADKIRGSITNANYFIDAIKERFE